MPSSVDDEPETGALDDSLQEGTERTTQSDSLWRQRAFLCTIGGQWISQLGNSAFRVALAFSSLSIVPSGKLLPQIFLAQGLGLIAALFLGGALVDRRSARMMLLVSDLVRGAIVLSVLLLLVWDRAEPWHLIALGFAFGVIDGAFQPALSAAVPELVPKSLIVRGNAINSVGRRTVTLIGAPLGGALMIVGAGWSFGLNAASYLIAAALLLAGRAWPYPHQAKKKDTKIFRDVRSGLSYVARNRWLLMMILMSSAGIVLVFAGAFSLLPLIFGGRTGGAVTYGLVLSFSSGGGIVGGLIMSGRRSIRRPALVFQFALAAVAGAYAGIALSAGFSGLVWSAVSSVVAFIAGLGTTIANVTYAATLQRLVPRALLGRVSSVDMLGSYALQPVANAAFGAVIGAVSISGLYVTTCVICVVVALVGSLSPHLRRLRLPDDD